MQNTRGLLSRAPWELSIPASTNILIITESWLEGTEVPAIPGFPYSFGLGRRAAAVAGTATRGGVAVYIRSLPGHSATVWRSRAADGVLWIQLNEPEPMCIAVCYLPPSHSGGCPRDVGQWFRNLADDITDAQALGRVLVAGDFNARTATLPDYEVVDEGPWLTSRLIDVHTGETSPLPLQRLSTDRQLNSHGRHLLHLCKVTGLRLLNGRTPGDTPAQATSTGVDGQGMSVVDYFLGSQHLLPKVTNLEVHHPLATPLDHQSVHLHLQFPTHRLLPPEHNVYGPDNGIPVPSTTSPTVPPEVLQDLVLRAENLPKVLDALLAPHVQAELDSLDKELAVETIDRSGLDVIASRFDHILRSALLEAGARPKSPNPPFRSPPISTPRWIRRKKRTAAQSDSRKQARKVLRRAQREGDLHGIIKARAEWQRTKRDMRRAAEDGLGDQLAKLLRSNPRAFFQTYQDRRRISSPAIPVVTLVNHYRRLLGAAPTHLLPPPGANSVTTHLSSPLPQSKFTEEELNQALKGIRNGGVVLGVLKPNVLKATRSVLVPTLAQFFNAIARVGSLPSIWSFSSITPLLKPGKPPDQCSSYRGIAVGSLPAKLYAMVLHIRLNNWLESNQLRADAQFGFRHGRSCAQAAFILRTITEQAQYKRQAVYSCFVDFKQAYDSVPRHLLWHKLKQKGIDGWMLQAILALYETSPMFVRTPCGPSTPFATTTGVRQGCPLSPLLFGLYIDDLAQELQALEASNCPKLNDLPAPCLLYADDLVHLALSGDTLQAQATRIEAYAQQWGLTVNAAKTKVMVFHKRGIEVVTPSIQYNNEHIEVVEAFKYLGILFHNVKGLAQENVSIRMTGGECAMYAMKRRLRELQIHDPKVHCQLYDTFVESIISYGLEVWGPQLLASYKAGLGPIETLQARFLKSMLGVGNHTPNSIVLAECGRWPCGLRWTKQLALFCNRLLTAKPGCLLHSAFAVARSLGNMRGSWITQVTKAIQIIGYSDIACRRVNDVEAKWKDWYCQQLQDAQGSKHEFYFGTLRDRFDPKTYTMPKYLTTIKPRSQRQALSQMRVGSHWLKEETLRWWGIARDERVCGSCGVVEDLHHVIFECPRYNELRSDFSVLFENSPSLSVFFSHHNVWALASFCRRQKLTYS